MTVKTVTAPVTTEVVTEASPDVDLAAEVQKVLNMPTTIEFAESGYLFDPQLIVDAFEATGLEPVTRSFGDAVASGCALSALSAWRYKQLKAEGKIRSNAHEQSDWRRWVGGMVPEAYQATEFWSDGIVGGFDQRGKHSNEWLRDAATPELDNRVRVQYQAAATAAKARELIEKKLKRKDF